MKCCADDIRGAKESSIKPGDTVLLKQPKENKFSAPYNPEPFIVEKRKGTMITAKNDSNRVTRNSSQFKVISTKSAVHDGKEVQPKVAKPSTLEEQKKDRNGMQDDQQGLRTISLETEPFRTT